jgi:hypothetical protein
MSLRNFLLILLAAAAMGAARGTLYKCRDASGHTVLRDRRCLAGEQVVEQVRPGEVQRQFTVVNPPPERQPAPPPPASRKPAPASAPAPAKP